VTERISAFWAHLAKYPSLVVDDMWISGNSPYPVYLAISE